MIPATAIKNLVRAELKAVRLQAREARIDPAYTSGLPKVVFAEDLESGTLSGPYAYVKSYMPMAGDWVLLIPSRNSYVIVDELITE